MWFWCGGFVCRVSFLFAPLCVKSCILLLYKVPSGKALHPQHFLGSLFWIPKTDSVDSSHICDTLYLFAPLLHKVTDTFLLWLFNTIPRGKGKVLFVKYFILPCVINRHHFQGFFICLLVCFIFCLMAIFLGIPSKALILHCYPESRLSSMSFCSNMQMASMQRPSQ